MRVLVTRPRHQSEKLLHALDKRGYQSDFLPLLQIVPFELSAADRLSIRKIIESVDKVIAVSANAAELGLGYLGPPGEKQLFAIGSATASVLKAEGYSVKVPEGDYNSESLLALADFEQVKGERIAILCGCGGRDYLELKLAEKQAHIDRIELYQRQPIKHRQIQLNRPDVLTAMSGDTAQALANALVDSGLADWQAIPILVPSERVSTIAYESGFTKILAAPKPTTESLLDLLVELEQAV